MCLTSVPVSCFRLEKPSSRINPVIIFRVASKTTSLGENTLRHIFGSEIHTDRKRDDSIHTPVLPRVIPDASLERFGINSDFRNLYQRRMESGVSCALGIGMKGRLIVSIRSIMNN